MKKLEGEGSNASTGLRQGSPQKKEERETLSKAVAVVAGPVGVPAVWLASSDPFGEFAQLETVGHNPRTASQEESCQASRPGLCLTDVECSPSGAFIRPIVMPARA